MTDIAPILLIGFNRPDFMRAQIDAVREAKPSRLYLAVDGPREGREDEAEKCAGVRECANLVDWPCEIKTLFRETNIGCKLGPSSAITWFFENEEAGIILEDDCRPTLDFIRFASEMLDRYRDDGRIGAVCGFNGFDLQSDRSTSYHFSSHMVIWGWATWRRAWAKYDVEWRDLRGKTDAIIENSGMNAYFKKSMKSHVRRLEDGLDTWAIQWVLYSMKNRWLNIMPKIRLISNVGFSAENATHTGGYNCLAKRWGKPCDSLDFPLVHPKAIEQDSFADNKQEALDASLYYRGLTWLGCKFPWLVPLLDLICQ